MARSYQIVLDYRKRPIRGLYLRHGAYFARVKSRDGNTGKIKHSWHRLEGVQGVEGAKAALKELQIKQAAGTLAAPLQSPKFSEYADKYLEFYRQVPDAKRAKTIGTEASHITALKEHFGETRLHKITQPQVRGFIAKRQMAGKAARTVNLGVIVLRNILNRAIEDGWLSAIPFQIKPLKATPARKDLLTHSDIERLCASAMEHSKNGAEFSYYVKFLAYSGARRNEALRVRWQDVDWDNGQVTIGWDGQTKNRLARVVDFNDRLELLLKEMEAHRPPDCTWLFPSPQRGGQDIAAKSFVETLRLSRGPAGLPKVGFHHMRHYFASFCVMSGIDFMTTARWLGHKDGGILIGRVYGHLAAEHTKAAARRLRFEPIVLDAQTA